MRDTVTQQSDTEQPQIDSPLSARPNLSAWLAIGTTVAVFFASRLLRAEHAQPAWKVAGVTLLACGAPLMFLPFVQLRKYGNPPAGAPYHATTLLVQRGLFGLVRHPQYLGYSLLTLGFGTLSGQWWLLPPAVLATLFYYLQARGEEAHCRRLFGDAAYDDYCRRTARFCPIKGILRLLRKP